jgi:hypothetical protein
MARRPLIEPFKTQGASDEEIRKRVYKAITAHVRELTEGELPQQNSETLGRDILDGVIELVWRTALTEGYFRLPGGFGSLKVQVLKSTQKRLPTGQVVDLTKSHRSRLRYEEGAAVRELLGMPYKTSYRRKFVRQSKLEKRAAEIAFPQSA